MQKFLREIFFLYFICRPSDSTASEDAGIESKIYWEISCPGTDAFCFLPKKPVSDVLENAGLLGDEEIVHGEGGIKELGLEEAQEERLLARLLIIVLLGGGATLRTLFLLLLRLLFQKDVGSMIGRYSYKKIRWHFVE